MPDRVREKNRQTDNRYIEGGEVWTVYLYRRAFGTNLPRCLDCYLARSTESCFIDVKPQIYCSREIQTHPQKAGVRTRIRHTRKKWIRIRHSRKKWIRIPKKNKVRFRPFNKNRARIPPSRKTRSGYEPRLKTGLNPTLRKLRKLRIRSFSKFGAATLQKKTLFGLHTECLAKFAKTNKRVFRNQIGEGPNIWKGNILRFFLCIFSQYFF